MGDWEPDQSATVNNHADGGNAYDNHSVFFWILPANASGTWKWRISDNTDNKAYSLHIKQKFQKLEGNLTDGNARLLIKSITIKGDSLQFTSEEETAGKETIRTYKGIVNNNGIVGTVVSQVNTKTKETAWKAQRDPSTIIPLGD